MCYTLYVYITAPGKFIVYLRCMILMWQNYSRHNLLLQEWIQCNRTFEAWNMIYNQNLYVHFIYDISNHRCIYMHHTRPIMNNLMMHELVNIRYMKPIIPVGYVLFDIQHLIHVSTWLNSNWSIPFIKDFLYNIYIYT